MTALGIPATLTNTTWTAPAGAYTLPAAKTICHGVVTVDLSACTLVDGGGTAGLLNTATDCTSLTVKGAGAPAGTGRGPLSPTTFTYTTSANPSAFINISDTALVTVTLNGFTSTGMPILVSGRTANPASKVVLRGVFCTGLSVGVETYASIDVDNTVLRGGGINTNPVGLHFFQYQGATPPTTRTLWVPGTYIRCVNSEVTGFVSSSTAGFLQGDAILAESDCEAVWIDNILAGYNSDSGILDSKANWAEIKNCDIYSIGGRAMSQHCMGNGTGPWNGLRSHDNTIHVINPSLASGGFTEAFQAEGILRSVNDTVVLAPGSRLAVTAFGDAPGSGAVGSYPRLGNISLYSPHNLSGTLLTGPLVHGDNSTHHTTITLDNSGYLPPPGTSGSSTAAASRPITVTLTANATVTHVLGHAELFTVPSYVPAPSSLGPVIDDTAGAARAITVTLTADATTTHPPVGVASRTITVTLTADAVVTSAYTPPPPPPDMRDLYRVTLYDPNLNPVGQITSWTQIRALPTFNGVGTWAIDLPLGQYAELIVPGGGCIIARHNKVLIAGPYTSITQTRSSAAPDGTVTLSGVSDDHVIADRLAYRDPAHAPNAQTTALDTRSGAAETVMYAYVNVNAGPGALVARQTPHLTLAPNLGRGSTITGNATFEVLSDLITTLALTDDLGWRVNRLPNRLLQFEVYAPQDLTKLVRFSWDLGNLYSYTYGTSGPAVTREIVLGSGDGMARVIVEVGLVPAETEWDRRIEKVLDQSSTSDIPTLTQAGIQQLAVDQPGLNLTLEPVDTATAAFGTDWNLGDQVTMIVSGVELAQVVRQVDVTVTKTGEVLKPVVGTPGTTNAPWFYTQARALIKGIQDQQRRR